MKLISAVEQITPEWLNEALDESGSELRGAKSVVGHLLDFRPEPRAGKVGA